MEQHIKKVINSLIQFRYIFFIVIAVAALGSSYLIFKNLTIDNSLSIWFLEDDPQYEAYTTYQSEYGSDEIIICMVTLQQGLSKNSFEKLEKIQHKLERLSVVERTYSIADVTYPIITTNTIQFIPLYDLNRSKKSRKKLLEDFSSLSNYVVSTDEKNIILYIQLKPTSEIENQRADLVYQIETVISSEFQDYHISGPPILNNAYNKEIFNESIWFGGMTILVISLLLLFLLPHIRYLPISLISISFPILLLFGFTSYWGYSLNMISMLIPTILLVYGVSDSIHMTNIFHVESQKLNSETMEDRIWIMLKKSIIPCSITTLTTMISYIALYLSPLPAFKDMGFLSSLGLLLSFCWGYIIHIIGFSFLSSSVQNKSYVTPLFDRFSTTLIRRFIQVSRDYKKQIILFFSIMLTASVFSICSISIDTKSLDLLADGDVKNDVKIIENQLGGSSRLQLNISTDFESDLLVHPQTLSKLKLFENAISKHKSLPTQPISINTLNEFITKRYPFIVKNNSDEKMVEHVLKYNNDASTSFFNLISRDGKELILTLTIPQLNTKELIALINFIEKEFKTVFNSSNFNLKINGFAVLYAKLNNFILETQLYSFLVAFIASFFVLLLFLKNLNLALLILLPNLIPIGAVLLTMYLFNISIDVTTAMITPIMLGIIMDDSIHLIYNYKRFKTNSTSIEQSINHSMNYTGKALIGSTLVLIGGFLVIASSSVPSVQNFGILCAITSAAALLSDFCLLPALLKNFKTIL